MERVIIGRRRRESEEALWAPAFRFSQKMRACSVYNGLILCREWLLHYCSTQLKVLTDVFCLKYHTDVIYVYMYSFMNVFLNPYTRTECNFFCHLVCYSVSLTTFQGPHLIWLRWPLLVLYSILCVFFFCGFIYSSLWLKEA